MIGYCISDKPCNYRSEFGYCNFTGGGCVSENTKTLVIPTEQYWAVTKVVDISTESIEAIADAVVRKLRGEQE